MPTPARAVLALLWAALSAAALAAAYREPPRTWGDAPEYLLMAEAVAAHGSPAYREEDVAAVAAGFARHGIAYPPGGKVIGYYEADDGRRYSYHFGGYSALTVPARLLTRDPLRAPAVANALLLSGALFSLAFLLPATGPVRALAMLLLFFSPAGWFVPWPHPEVFSAAFTTFALVAAARHRPATAVLCAAIGALQNPQLMLLAGALWALAVVRAEGSLRPRLRLALSLRWGEAIRVAAPAVVFALHPGFYLLHFGTPSIVANEATSLAKVSIPRALGLLFDLNVGLLPYVPGLLLVALALLGRDLVRRRPTRELVLGAALAAILLVDTLQWNYNHGSSGPSRYVVWILPVLVAIAVGGTPDRRRLLALGLAAVAQIAIFASRGGFRSPYDYLEHSPAARAVLRRWPALYDPDYEVFIKRTRHTEGHTEGPYVYAVEGRCRKVLANRTHEGAVRAACSELPPGTEAFFREASRHPGRDWRYLDY